MPRPTGIALLLSRVGAKVSADFAERVSELGLTPAQVSVLRVVGQTPGIGQQELAARIGSVPSRVTKLVDELEAEGLVARQRSASDRRNVELRLVAGAGDRLAGVRRAVSAHDAAVVGGLGADDRATLLRLLGQVAGGLGLGPDDHPGLSPDGGRGSSVAGPPPAAPRRRPRR